MQDFAPGYPIDLRDGAMVRRQAAGPYGDFEGGAARAVARATGLRTLIQDDNRIPRTPDLRVESDEGVIGFGEVVTTTDGARADHLRAFSRGHLAFESPKITGTWWVGITTLARRKGLESLLVDVFAKLEERGDHRELGGFRTGGEGPPEIRALERQGLIEIMCDPTPRTGHGKIYVHPESTGGPVAVDWGAAALWIDEFLATDLCQRKCEKLINAGDVAERHLYVGITGSDPWPVHRVLEEDLIDCLLPSPALPVGITHLWLTNAEFPSRCLSWWPERGWFDVRTRWATN